MLSLGLACIACAILLAIFFAWRWTRTIRLVPGDRVIYMIDGIPVTATVRWRPSNGAVCVIRELSPAGVWEGIQHSACIEISYVKLDRIFAYIPKESVS